MTEHKPTTAVERAIWKRNCGRDSVNWGFCETILRLIADVERLENRTTRLDALVEQLVGEELISQEGLYETEMQRIGRMARAGRQCADVLDRANDKVVPLGGTVVFDTLEEARKVGLLPGGRG